MKDLCRGCVVRMKASSNMVGYGNLQCVSSYVEELGEVGFFGHNQLYKDYHIAEIVERPEELGEAEKTPSNTTKVQICPHCEKKVYEITHEKFYRCHNSECQWAGKL